MIKRSLLTISINVTNFLVFEHKASYKQVRIILTEVINDNFSEDLVFLGLSQLSEALFEARFGKDVLYFL